MSDLHLPTSESRRNFIKNTGRMAIALPFLPGCLSPEEEMEMEMERITVNRVFEKLPGSLRRAPKVNAWLEILADGRVRIFSGKVELGQGIRTAIKQVAAEELYLDLDRVEVVLAETGLTPNEGYTAGSGSIQNSAMSVRYAAAAGREKLLELAAQQLNVGTEALKLDNGFIKSLKSEDRLSFAEVLDGKQIEGEVPLNLQLKSKETYQYVGKAISRDDLGEIVTGKALFIHDLKLPDMVHARVLRPSNYQSKLLGFDETAFQAEAEGVLKVVKNGNFLGVIAKREYQAEKALQLLTKHSQWSKPAIFPPQDKLAQYFKETADKPEIAHGKEAVIDPTASAISLKASYFKSYTMHATMGPTCAIGHYDGEILHIWSHSQGIYPMREGLATMLGLAAEKIHVISAPGSGCYGHTVADDAAADAAVLAMAYPGQPIRVRWSREDEHRWEPYGSAMLMELEAGVDSKGQISFWRSNIWTDSHSTRPNKNAGTLLTARYLDPPFEMKSRGYLRGGHRNGDPYYAIPQMQILAHYFDGPLRVSSLRSLGAFGNIFAIESFMDELAEKAGQDVFAFRLNHLEDERAVAVVKEVQQMIQGLEGTKEQGLGVAFCRYKNTASYCAMAAQVSVDASQGQVKLEKIWAAVDVGEVINLDGIKSQVEGAILQAAAWTLREEVRFDAHEITSVDWASYEILRIGDSPAIEVAVIDRPTEAAMGGGEVGTPPVAAAICNAIYRACGQRVHSLPVRLV